VSPQHDGVRSGLRNFSAEKYLLPMKIKILYEDPDVLVIDKPSGISVHSDLRSEEKTIADWFLKKYPKAENVGESIFTDGKEIKKPGIVHRLDKDTSGVLLLAKNQKAYEFLKNQFKNKMVKKIYHAIVSGFVKKDHDVVNKPIGRSPRDFRRRLAGRGVRGDLREAITEYIVLKRFEAKAEHHEFFYARGSQPVLREGRSAKKIHDAPLNKFSYLEIHPKTGRTHQIRVHMKFINHPIVCDELYNPGKPCPKGLERLALHAKSVEFQNLKGKVIKVESPLPKGFSDLLNC